MTDSPQVHRVRVHLEYLECCKSAWGRDMRVVMDSYDKMLATLLHLERTSQSHSDAQEASECLDEIGIIR